MAITITVSNNSPMEMRVGDYRRTRLELSNAAIGLFRRSQSRSHLGIKVRTQRPDAVLNEATIRLCSLHCTINRQVSGGLAFANSRCAFQRRGEDIAALSDCTR